MENTLFWLVVGFCIAGFLPYWYGIIKGTAKPSKATWIIWASLDAITLVAMYQKDKHNAQIICSTAGATIVALLALYYGEPGWTTIDKICLGSAFAGVILLIFATPLMAIFTTLAGICIGSIPTFERAWESPQKENKIAWMAFFLACVCAVADVPQWTWEDGLQPIVFLAIETTMIHLVWIRPLYR